MRQFLVIMLLFFATTVNAEKVVCGSDVFDPTTSSFNVSAKQICDEDKIKNALSYIVAESYQKSKTIQSAFDYFKVEPPLTPTTISSSRKISEIIKSCYGLFVKLIIAGLFYRVVIGSMNAMQGEVKADSKTMRSVALFAVVCFLNYPISGGYPMVYWLTVVCTLSGLSLLTWGQSSMLPFFVFDFGAVTKDNVYNPNAFIEQGRGFAVDLIKTVQSSRNTVLITNRANGPTFKDSEFLEDESKLWKVEEIWGNLVSAINMPSLNGLNTYYEEYSDLSDVRLASGRKVIEDLGSGSVVKLRYAPMSSCVGRICHNKMSSMASFNVERGRVNDEGEVVLPIISTKTDTDDLFETENTGLFRHPVELKDTKLLVKLVNSGAVEILQSLYGANHSKAVVDQKSRELISVLRLLAGEDKDLFQKLAKQAGAFALGVADVSQFDDKTKQRKGTVYNYNPLDISTIKQNTPFGKVLPDAYVAAEYVTQFNCINAVLSDFDKSYSDAQIYAKSKVEGDFDKGHKEADSDYHHLTGQCYTFNNNILGSLYGEQTTELFVKTYQSLKENPTPEKRTEVIEKMFTSNKSLFTSMADKALEKGREKKEEIARYYSAVHATVMAASMNNNIDDLDGSKTEVMSDLRRFGYINLPAFFFAISDIQDDNRQTITSSDPATSYYAQSSTYLTAPISEETKSDSVLFNGLFDNFMEFGKTFAIPLSGEGDYSNVNENDLVVEEVDNLSQKFLSIMVDFIVPSDHVIKGGFGFDPEKSLIDGYKSCAFTSSCVEFTAHPIAIVSSYGKDLIKNAINLWMFGSVMSFLSDSVDSIVDSIGAAFGDVGESRTKSILKSVTELVAKFGGAMIKALLMVFKIAGVISIAISVVFLLLGVVAGYILPVIPFLAVVTHIIVWITDVAVMAFAGIPMSFLMIIERGGKPFLSPATFFGTLGSIILRPVLSFVSFVIFYVMTYVAFYLLNSSLYHVVNMATFSTSSITAFMASAVGFIAYLVILVGLYYAVIKVCVNYLNKLPDYILDALEIKSFAGNLKTGVDTVIAGALTNKIDQQHDKLTQGSKSKLDEVKRFTSKNKKG